MRLAEDGKTEASSGDLLNKLGLVLVAYLRLRLEEAGNKTVVISLFFFPHSLSALFFYSHNRLPPFHRTRKTRALLLLPPPLLPVQVLCPALGLEGRVTCSLWCLRFLWCLRV